MAVNEYTNASTTAMVSAEHKTWDLSLIHISLNVTYGIGDEQFDCEGRVICAEFPEFYLVTVYTPNRCV